MTDKQLPNLCFNIVSSNTLNSFSSDMNFNNNDTQYENIKTIIHEYKNSGDTQIKENLKKDYLTHIKELDINNNSIGSYNPFISNNKSIDCFNSSIMMGYTKFDIVIGNPPYGLKLDKETRDNYKKTYKTKSNNSVAYFIQLSLDLLKNNGSHSFIIPKQFAYIENWLTERNKILPYLSKQIV